jgi:hypothetical protein
MKAKLNPLCLECRKACKQAEFIKVVCCPFYEPKIERAKIDLASVSTMPQNTQETGRRDTNVC